MNTHLTIKFNATMDLFHVLDQIFCCCTLQTAGLTTSILLVLQCFSMV